MTRMTFGLFAISACTAAASACSDATTGNSGNAANGSGGAPGVSGGSNTGGNTGGSQTSTAGASGGGASSVGNGGTTSTNGGTGGTTGASGTSGTGGSIVSNGDVSTDPNLKIGFIGDTDSGANFTNVLNLVKSEGASALVVEGDMSYSADPTAWWNALEGVMGTEYPVFISRGNHDDSSWSGYLPKAEAHLGGATREAGAHDANYKTTYRGLVIAAIKKGDTGSNIAPFLQADPHIWKICSWHQNQQSMQIGGRDGTSTRRAASRGPSSRRATSTATSARRR